MMNSVAVARSSVPVVISTSHASPRRSRVFHRELATADSGSPERIR
jgi:hypothetical protein